MLKEHLLWLQISNKLLQLRDLEGFQWRSLGFVGGSNFDTGVFILHLDGDSSFLIRIVSGNFPILLQLSDFIEETTSPLGQHEVDKDISCKARSNFLQVSKNFADFSHGVSSNRFLCWVYRN